MSYLDAISLTSLVHIRNDDNLAYILEQLGNDDYLKHNFGDCLGPQFSIPGLIEVLLNAPGIHNTTTTVS